MADLKDYMGRIEYLVLKRQRCTIVCLMLIIERLMQLNLFGLKENVQSNIHYLEENVFLYPVGHNIVIYDTGVCTHVCTCMYGMCV